MEDHFNNPDYMDSEKFPKASFFRKITNLADVNFAKDGNYNVTVEGNLTIKNVTKPVSTKGTITVGGGKVTAKATFSVKEKNTILSAKLSRNQRSQKTSRLMLIVFTTKNDSNRL